MILLYYFFFFNDTATTEIYTLSLHDALPILRSPMLTKFVSGRIVKGSRPLKRVYGSGVVGVRGDNSRTDRKSTRLNSSHSQISYAVFCLKKKKKKEINGAVLRMNSHASRSRA